MACIKNTRSAIGALPLSLCVCVPASGRWRSTAATWRCSKRRPTTRHAYPRGRAHRRSVHSDPCTLVLNVSCRGFKTFAHRFLRLSPDTHHAASQADTHPPPFSLSNPFSRLLNLHILQRGPCEAERQVPCQGAVEPLHRTGHGRVGGHAAIRRQRPHHQSQPATVCTVCLIYMFVLYRDIYVYKIYSQNRLHKVVSIR